MRWQLSSDTPPMQLLLGGAGALSVLGLLAFFVVSAFTAPHDRTAVLRVELATPVPSGDGWLVPFRAVNDGPAPVAQLELVADLRAPSGESERSEATIDYLGGHSEAEGGFLFATDPRRASLRARPAAFTEP